MRTERYRNRILRKRSIITRIIYAFAGPTYKSKKDHLSLPVSSNERDRCGFPITPSIYGVAAFCITCCSTDCKRGINTRISAKNAPLSERLMEIYDAVERPSIRTPLSFSHKNKATRRLPKNPAIRVQFKSLSYPALFPIGQAPGQR